MYVRHKVSFERKYTYTIIQLSGIPVSNAQSFLWTCPVFQKSYASDACQQVPKPRYLTREDQQIASFQKQGDQRQNRGSLSSIPSNDFHHFDFKYISFMSHFWWHLVTRLEMETLRYIRMIRRVRSTLQMPTNSWATSTRLVVWSPMKYVRQK